MLKKFIVILLFSIFLGFSFVEEYGKIPDSQLGYIIFKQNTVQFTEKWKNYLLDFAKNTEKELNVKCILVHIQVGKAITQIAVLEKINNQWTLKWIKENAKIF